MTPALPPILTSTTPTGTIPSQGISPAPEAETATTQSIFNAHLPKLSEGVHLTPEQKHTFQPQSALLQTPSDVLCLVLSYLNGSELVAASRTCQRLHQVAQNELLYKALLEKEFPWRKLQKGVSLQKQYHDAAAFYQNVKKLEFKSVILKEGREKCDCDDRTFSSDEVHAVKAMDNLLIFQYFCGIEIWKQNTKGCLYDFQEISMPWADETSIHVLEPFLFITACHKQNYFFQLQQKEGWFEQVSMKKCLGSVFGDLCLIENPENHSLSVMKVGAERTLEEQQVLEVPESEKAQIEGICTMKESGGLLVVQYAKLDSSGYFFMIWEKNQKGQYENLAQLNGDCFGILFLQRSGDFLFMQENEKILYWKKGETSFNCVGDNFGDVDSFDVIGNLMILHRSRPEDIMRNLGPGKLELFHFDEEETPQGLKLLHTLSHINYSLLIGDLLLTATDDSYDPETCEPYLQVWQIEANGALTLLQVEDLLAEIDHMEFVNDSLILDYSSGKREIRYFSPVDIKKQKELEKHKKLSLSV